MFRSDGVPNIFALPPGVDFAAEFADGLMTRTADKPPEFLPTCTVLANSRRTVRALQQAFMSAGALLLPRIGVVTDIAPLIPVLDRPLDPPVSTLRRRLELAQLVKAFVEHQPGLAPRSAVFDLADSLAALLAEMQIENVPYDRIRNLDVAEHSAHWSRRLAFLDIVREFLDGEAPDTEAQQRMLLQQLLAAWNRETPPAPVIIAGSTGSRGTTLDLMVAAAKLDNCAVVLPGFDWCLPSAAWAAMEDVTGAEDHPQFRFKKLLDRLGRKPSEVARWTKKDVDLKRQSLVSLALRPAPVTDQWLTEGPMLPDVVNAVQDLTLIEAPSPRIEALSLALVMRQAMENRQSVCLITPDRNLSRHVAAALDRWGIEPDDSAGRPLGLSPPGRFLRHVARLLGRQPTAVDLLTILKHPLCARGGSGRGDHLRFTRDLELFIRHRGMPFPNAGDLAAWALDSDASHWAAWIGDILNRLNVPNDLPLSSLIQEHVNLTEALVAGPDADGLADQLWVEAAGREALAQMTALSDAADGLAGLECRDYVSIFERQFASAEVRQPNPSNPDIQIRGPLEARLQNADLILLGGLNETTWPATPEPDPWLNRKMRRDIGLLLPERQIGLAAHDFQQVISHRRVVLARAVRSDDAQTVPSRWVNRLTNLLSGLASTLDDRDLAAEMRNRGQVWIDLAERLDRPAERTTAAPRPSPVPPKAALPRQLSVTGIRTLIRDPYAIYGRDVLRLRPLNPLLRIPDAALRGTLLHDVLEDFVGAVNKGDLPLTPGALLQRVNEILTQRLPWPSVRRLWLARFGRVANWFVEGEQDRRRTARAEGLEVSGRLALPDLGFTLTAKADRVDVDPDGKAHIYDYKTGKPPSAAQQKAFDNQLLLEALMLEEGAFDGFDAVDVTAASYLGLGTSPSQVAAPLVDMPPTRMKSELVQLLTAYLADGTGFTSRRAAEREQWEGDYDHLARFGEWDLTVRPTKVTLK